MVVGRGSSIEAFPLFGFDLNDYDALFAEKLDLLLTLRDNEHVEWSGEFRPPLTGQGVYPRPVQDPLPIWLGVGGTPTSFARAGALGLPLMVAIIGGEPRRFRPLVDLYREAVGALVFRPINCELVCTRSAMSRQRRQAHRGVRSGYLEGMTKAGKERGWGQVSRAHFDAQVGRAGALIVGGPDEVIEKIQHYDEALGGISRLTFQMDLAALPQAKLLRAIELIGSRVAPALRGQAAAQV